MRRRVLFYAQIRLSLDKQVPEAKWGFAVEFADFVATRLNGRIFLYPRIRSLRVRRRALASTLGQEGANRA